MYVFLRQLSRKGHAGGDLFMALELKWPKGMLYDPASPLIEKEINLYTNHSECIHYTSGGARLYLATALLALGADDVWSYVSKNTYKGLTT